MHTDDKYKTKFRLNMYFIAKNKYSKNLKNKKRIIVDD